MVTQCAERVNVSGVLHIDLRDVEPDRARHRLACLPRLPSGVRVVVNIGTLAVNVPAVVAMQAEGRRLSYEIWGSDYAVPRWIEALRGDPYVSEGVLTDGPAGT